MLITCPRCQTVFRLADEMLPVDVSSVKVKCSHCQTVFSLPEPVPPEAEIEQVETSVTDEVTAERSASSFEVSETTDAEMKVDFTAENESKADEGVKDIFDVSEGLDEESQAVPEAGSMGIDAGVEETDAETGESNRSDGEKTDGTVADEVVFELADDFEDDLSWDIDDDHEVTAAPGSEQTEAVENKQTVMDEEGLSSAAADDGKKETKSFSAEPEMSEHVMPVTDDGGLRNATEEEIPPAEELAKVRLDSRRTFLFLGLIFLVLSLAVWGGMLLWQKFSIDMEKHLSIVGLESRNYIFSSDKRVIAIRGKIYNTSPKVVGTLRIKGVIVDRQGKVLAERVTSGGVSFSADELQNLDGKMVEKLENPAAIVPANGGELPFMLVFYGFPPSASSYHVELDEFSVLKKGKKP